MHKPQETWVLSFNSEDPLEEETATHANILAGIIPWTEESCGLQESMGHKESDTTEWLNMCARYFWNFFSVLLIHLAMNPAPHCFNYRIYDISVNKSMLLSGGVSFHSLLSFHGVSLFILWDGLLYYLFKEFWHLVKNNGNQWVIFGGNSMLKILFQIKYFFLFRHSICSYLFKTLVWPSVKYNSFLH